MSEVMNVGVMNVGQSEMILRRSLQIGLEKDGRAGNWKLVESSALQSLSSLPP